MILSANQPYFFPFPGFFLKAFLSDVFVILDEVQFPRGTTWLTRNRFKNEQGTLWMTIPVWKKGLGLQKINEVRICREGRWPAKHKSSLLSAYAKSPFLEDHLEIIERIFSSKLETLLDLNLTIIRYLMKQLRIDTRIVLLSELENGGTGTRLLIETCKKIGADSFLAQRPASKYLDFGLLRDAGIDIRFFSPPSIIYPQLWGDFIPNLSTFDLILNCGPKAHDILTSKYKA